MPPVNILLADNQYLTSAGIIQTCKEISEVQVGSQVHTKEELFIELQKDSQISLIYALQHDGDFSMATLGEIKGKYPETAVIVISTSSQKETISQILHIGAESILTENCSKEEFTQAIRASARKEKFFCNTILELILEGNIKADADTLEAQPNLTNRESEILRLISTGKSTRNIADSLSLSTHTVYTHRKNIMRKLGVGSGPELILYALRTGIIDSKDIGFKKD